MKKTKIVCTLGPVSSSLDKIGKLLRAGMDVARINMSHGSHADHALVIKRLRLASSRLAKPLAILLDLQGPKIRTGKLGGGAVDVRSGDKIVLTTQSVVGTANRISVSYKRLPKDVKTGDAILMDDGKLRLKVLDVKGTEVRCRVIVGGRLSDHKGINLPGVALSTDSVTAKDFEDLKFGLDQGVDYVALSFVRRARDVERVKRFIAARGKTTPVIAKIEKPEALEHLHAIARVSDGVMVARGDLGVELDLEKVPLIQKELIRLANESKILVITATQMLESMTENPTPTRAEASDVANAIFDGTDAVMLSAETAVGKYPLEATAMMTRICLATENSLAYRETHGFYKIRHSDFFSISDAVSYAARAASDDLRARAFICFTQSGATAKFLAKYRPEIPIYVFTSSKSILRQMGLLWGTRGFLAPRGKNADQLFKRACEQLKKAKLINRGETVIMLSDTLVGDSESNNMMKIHKVE